MPRAVDPGRGEQVERDQDGAGDREPDSSAPFSAASAHMWWASSAAATITMTVDAAAARPAPAPASDEFDGLDGSVTAHCDARNGMQPQPCGGDPP